MNFKQFLSNQTVLYVVFALSLASLLGYVMTNKTDAVLFFLLAGYITSHFSKNMTVIMLVGLLSTNLIFGLNKMREGMENKTETKDKKTKSQKAAEENRMPSDEDLELAEGKNPGSIPPASGSMDAAMVGEKDPATMAAALKGKQKKGAEEDDEVEGQTGADKKKKTDVAYSYFEKAMNEGGMDKLSDDMDNMVAKHEKLETMINNMGPIIDKAGKLLDKVNTTNIGGIGDIVNKMSGVFGKL
jgi:hypothetical protein